MRKAKLAGALALISAVGIVAAAPAGAGVIATAASQAAFCEPMSGADTRLFGGSADGNALFGRGGVVREPDWAQTHADLPASAKGKAGRNFKATIPVYFHVITDGAIGNAHGRADRRPDRGAQQHLRRRRGRRQHRLHFTLAGVTRTDNAELVLRRARAASRSTR